MGHAIGQYQHNRHAHTTNARCHNGCPCAHIVRSVHGIIDTRGVGITRPAHAFSFVECPMLKNEVKERKMYVRSFLLQ